MGFPVGPLLQFGARAYALKKSWQDRYQPWRELCDEVVVLGPALQSSMTTTNYYAQSLETKKFFYTDDWWSRRPISRRLKKLWYIFQSCSTSLDKLSGTVRSPGGGSVRRQLYLSCPCSAWKGRNGCSDGSSHIKISLIQLQPCHWRTPHSARWK